MVMSARGNDAQIGLDGNSPLPPAACAPWPLPSRDSKLLLLARSTDAAPLLLGMPPLLSGGMGGELGRCCCCCCCCCANGCCC